MGRASPLREPKTYMVKKYKVFIPIRDEEKYKRIIKQLFFDNKEENKNKWMCDINIWEKVLMIKDESFSSNVTYPAFTDIIIIMDKLVLKGDLKKENYHESAYYRMTDKK
jgi:hypothetical protein